MDEMIIKEIIKDRLVLLGLFLCSAAIMIFCVIGVYDAFWNVPAKRATIAELTDQRNTWQCRVNELERYIDEREEQYQVAMKFEDLFMLIANPNQVMKFEDLDQYIKNKKDFFETNLSKK